MRIYRESQLQRACFSWFKIQYRYFKKDYINEKGQVKQIYPLIKNCNEGDKSVIKRMIEGLEGLQAGVADMSLKVGTEKYHGLEIEFKRPGGKQTASQKAYQVIVEQQGYKYIIIYSFDEFVKELEDYLK